jgi:hypothetical protein
LLNGLSKDARAPPVWVRGFADLFAYYFGSSRICVGDVRAF